MTRGFTWDVNAGRPVILDDGSQYIHGAGLLAQIAGANTYYYLADGLGSTMATSDSSGAVVNSYTYDVYGKTTASSGVSANDFQFAAQQTDPTGLQYLRASYYDPEVGGFLSRDPLAVSTLGGRNPFSYAASNPGRFCDDAGLKETDGSPDNRNLSARQKICWEIAGQIVGKVAQMVEDREVIEGRGTGRPVTDDDKKGKQRRWRNFQGTVQNLWDRFSRLGCPDEIGMGWVPGGLDDALNGEYPKFKAQTHHWWDDIPSPHWPEVPDNIWWNDPDWWKQLAPSAGGVPAPVY